MKKKHTRQSGNIHVNKGQEIPVTIKKIGINGEGIGYFKRKTVFIPGALPGEEVIARVEKNQPNYIEAKLNRIRKRSKYRIEPPCPIYDQCGGCQLQHLRYDKQLEFKRDMILQALDRYMKKPVDPGLIKPAMGMDHPWGYRNKSQLQVGKKKGKTVAGLYQEGSHYLVDVTDCQVQHPDTNKVTKQVLQIIDDLNIPIYHERKREGFVRRIVVRTGFETGEIQLVIITADKHFPKKELFIREVKRRLPEVTSVLQNVNPRKTSLIFGEETYLLAGKEYMEEKLGDISYDLSARAFFQLNPIQTKKLYNEVKILADLTGDEKVVDAYCGVGTIGLWLAEGVKELRGIEVIDEAVKDARRNAEKLGIQNAKYVTGKAEDWLYKWHKEGFKPDVVIVDPPRAGLDHRLVEALKKIRPKKLIYVSCNPSTLAKNLDALSSKFAIKSIQPIDMFPQTSHVESITLLTI
ncbi:MAG: 23S rRNA (uracil(1939)-C(5))-methyltransferase RlmD [Bacillaceae bacterium]|nr:23S rRNA (uracil(1939)-C(5))-methyltransferase RlmD [Bacillaceae bacterium]